MVNSDNNVLYIYMHTIYEWELFGVIWEFDIMNGTIIFMENGTRNADLMVIVIE